jgi:hypothetical protein
MLIRLKPADMIQIVELGAFPNAQSGKVEGAFSSGDIAIVASISSSGRGGCSAMICTVGCFRNPL